jgi:hypothetical protein
MTRRCEIGVLFTFLIVAIAIPLVTKSHVRPGDSVAFDVRVSFNY